MRLRTVSPDQPGIRRLRRGRGFGYVHASGRAVSAAERRRIEELVIPPAWTDVWICELANGHIQAVGTDDAGRRQYLYHPVWRERRDRDKFEHALTVGQRLPVARSVVTRHLKLPGMPAERALATAFRLLDLGFFRIGGESYTEQHGSYGLATLLRRHVSVRGGVATFRYAAKSGQRRDLTLQDAQTIAAVRAMLARKGGGNELLAYRRGRVWVDVTSSDINAYVKERLGEDVSAKDFRTWHATVLAALELASRSAEATSRTARQRVEREAVREVAERLGNTRTVARNSYIDPQVIESFRRGQTVDCAFTAAEVVGSPRRRAVAERALLRLLSG
ncbi:MAG: DNA topoisomerase IB [Actinomycetales bacterium]